jgi:GIY-YIG catalytic domain
MYMPCKICREKGHNARTCKLLTPSSVPIDIEGQDNSTLIVCPPKKYYCYIIKQTNVVNSLTYIGYTVNYKRRIRQHNCIIKGGAFLQKNEDHGLS